jgi:hypothetical protein
LATPRPTITVVTDTFLLCPPSKDKGKARQDGPNVPGTDASPGGSPIKLKLAVADVGALDRDGSLM